MRRVTLPAPGTDAQFHELVGEYLSPPLDRSKPLWELWLVDGFEDDRFGIVYKTHHAMADGISAVDIGMLLFDVEPKDEIVRAEEPWDPQTPPSRRRLLGRAVRGFFGMFAGAARWLLAAPRSEPGTARKRAADGVVGLWEVDWNLAKPAPKVPFNTEIGPARSFAWTSCALADFKLIKNALGGTVNDVTLAVAAGALRRWLRRPRGRPRRARAAGAGPGLGPHRERARRARQPADRDARAAAGPHRRPRRAPALRHQRDGRAEGLQAGRSGAEAIWGLNDWFREFAPPLLLNPTATINFSTRLFNLLVTNFPGPQVPSTCSAAS